MVISSISSDAAPTKTASGVIATTFATMEITGTDSVMVSRTGIEMGSGVYAEMIAATMIGETAIAMTMTGREGVDATRLYRLFEIGAWRRARGYFGAAESLRDFEIL